MCRAVLLCYCLLASFSPSFSQQSKVRFSSLMLSQEKTGWRVDSPTGANGASLYNGDLLIAIDGRNAGKMGPLGVVAAINAAMDAPVPLIVQRGIQRLKINFCTSHKPALPMKLGATQRYVGRSQKAPDFVLPTLDGVPTRLSAQRGKWVLISFWATWCGACQEEAEMLNRLAKTYPQRLTVLAPAVNDTREKLRAFSEKLPPFYTILDGGSIQGQPAISYGIAFPNGGATAPVSVLVRPDGSVAYAQAGYEPGSPLEQQVVTLITAR